MIRTLSGVSVALAFAVFCQDTGQTQGLPLLQIHATQPDALRSWDDYVIARERTGNLRVLTTDNDPLMPSRSIERLQQFHAGVPVWGATIVRDLDRSGVPQSFFGALSPDLTLSVEPGASAAAARTALLTLGGSEAVLLREPALVILRLDSGDHRLAYTAVVAGGADVFRVFIDAQTRVELLRYTELQSQQAAVGTGTGVLGDQKKLSVDASAGTYIAFDRHRPPIIQTFDMRGDPLRWLLLRNRYEDYVMNDYARDSDNVWSDIGIVDAHVHVSWAYDYYYKRFGRHGANNMNSPVNMLMNRIMQEDFLDYPGQFYANASWCPSCGPGQGGMIWFGTGFPKPWRYRSSGQNLNHFSGALDIAAHEYTHAVLTYSSNLIYYGESGALNEAFADMMGMSVEFFYHPPSSTPFTGSEVGKADYVMGEDIQRAMEPWARDGGRSAENPGLYGDPDHYSIRYLGQADYAGVHSNSGIANQAFYLSIEGGTNRTSGSTVQGVGAANRAQIEKVFYRAFVYLLPSNATFTIARAATTQAARDLYGAGGAVEVAVTQAWTAVGVF
jgi:bacillolysin